MKEINNKGKNIVKSSLLFLILMGLVSMMSDMTHEGARSIYGTFLDLAGASPYLISFISGLGELIGCSLIFITGLIANKTKKLWVMTIIGYSINLLAIPALCLTMENGYIYACIIISLERVGRAIRKPAKSTLVSFASKNLGEGKSFAFVEVLDQIGAFLGPLIVTLVLLLDQRTNLFESYKTAFLVLGIPAILTLVLLLFAKHKYPNPEKLEETNEQTKQEKFKISRNFVFYLIAISFCALGFIDFPLITYHVSTLNIFKTTELPLLYSLAMLVDAFSALLFRILFDKIGLKTLLFSTLLSFSFALLIFYPQVKGLIIIGVVLWGIGMGAQESILKSSVAKLVNKNDRSFGFGVFEAIFGFSWFIGSAILGQVYTTSITIFIILSMALQFASLPFYVLALKANTIKDKTV